LDADGRAMARAIAEVVGRSDMKVKALSWLLVGLGGLLQRTPREVYKMRYLWRTPARLDNSKLVAFLGEEPHTPPQDAVRTTLKALKIG
jgi:nucleoside-diphosphate-sugar epimerase